MKKARALLLVMFVAALFTAGCSSKSVSTLLTESADFFSAGTNRFQLIVGESFIRYDRNNCYRAFYEGSVLTEEYLENAGKRDTGEEYVYTKEGGVWVKNPVGGDLYDSREFFVPALRAFADNPSWLKKKDGKYIFDSDKSKELIEALDGIYKDIDYEFTIVFSGGKLAYFEQKEKGGEPIIFFDMEYRDIAVTLPTVG